jgi:hypothetical protein
MDIRIQLIKIEKKMDNTTYNRQFFNTGAYSGPKIAAVA